MTTALPSGTKVRSTNPITDGLGTIVVPSGTTGTILRMSGSGRASRADVAFDNGQLVHLHHWARAMLVTK